MVNVSLKRACLVGHPIKHALLRLLKLSVTHCNDRYCQLPLVFLYSNLAIYCKLGPFADRESGHYLDRLAAPHMVGSQLGPR